MSLIFSLLANETFLKLAYAFIEYFVSQNAITAEQEAAFKKTAEVLRAQGLKTLRSRFDSEDQIAAGNAVWDEREKK